MMRCYFWWIGIWKDVHQHTNTCKLCIQFLLNRVYMQLMHLEIPQVPFTSCATDCTGPLPASSKGHRYTLTFIFLLTSYLITLPLKTKTADEVSMAYIKEILPKTSCPKFILQDNGTELKNEQLMTVFDSLGIKWIYSNPYSQRGNSRVENFLKWTIVKFTHGSQLEWDNALPLATYCFNTDPSVNELESPFY